MRSLVGARRPDEGIVGRYGIVPRRIARKVIVVHVETQDVAEQIADVLSAVKGVAAAAAVAERSVEIAVGSETEPARLVVARARLRDGDDRRGARGVRDVRIRRYVIAADLGVAAGIDQIDVEKPVAGVVRIECEAEQPALPIRQDLARYVEERGCQNLSAIEVENLDQPGLLDNEQPTGIIGWRAGEERLIESARHPGRGDGAGVVLRPVRVIAVDDVHPCRALQSVAAVSACDEVRHGNLRYELIDPAGENSMSRICSRGWGGASSRPLFNAKIAKSFIQALPHRHRAPANRRVPNDRLQYVVLTLGTRE